MDPKIKEKWEKMKKESTLEDVIELYVPSSDSEVSDDNARKSREFSMTFKIRPYEDGDFERFFALHRESIRDEMDPHGLMSGPDFEDKLLKTLERYGFPYEDNMIFVAETPNSEYAGHIWFSQKHQIFNGRPEGRIYDLSVSERFRSMGLGNALMQKAESFCRDLGIPQMTLHQFTPNPVARHLYEKRGYRITSIKFSKPL
jgi:ribosomal protein S18 acetylase RimI-like enzyme